MSERKGVIAVSILAAAIYLGAAKHPPSLLDDADTVHAEAAREMAESGDWITLHANGIRYLEKAPLMYWLVALSYKVAGVNEFATRLPMALASVALALVAVAIGRYLFGPRAGIYAGLIISSCVGIFLFTRVLWPDILLTLFESIAFYCFLRSLDESGKSRWALGIYIAGALGVLTKGLVGAAFPAIIIFAYLLLTGDLRRLARLRLVSGTALFLIIAAPWHIAAGLANPGSMMMGTPAPGQGKGFFWFYFMNEHLLRYLGKRYPQDYDTVPLLLFLGLHMAWLFPWSFFLPLAIRDFPRRLRGLDRENRSVLFLWVWAGVVILFFCFSTTQEYYTMPAYPAFALLLGEALSREEEDRSLRTRKLLMLSQVAIAAAGVAVFVIGSSLYFKTRSIQVQGDIASTLTRNPDAYALSLGHVLDLTPESLSMLEAPLLITAVAFLLGTTAALVFRLRGRAELAAIALAVMMGGFFFCARASMSVLEPYLSSRPLAEVINGEYKNGDLIVINGEYESGSSINFYTRRQVHILNGRRANLEYGSYFKDAPDLFLDDSDITRLWEQSERIFLVTDAEQAGRLKQLLRGKVFTVAASGGKLIFSNQES